MSYIGSKYNRKQFIREVQARPTLWDPKADDYRDRNRRAYCWLEIAEIFFDKPNGSDLEKSDYAKTLQLKWKSLRDSYNLHKRRVRAGLATRGQYCNSKILNFLDGDSDIFVQAEEAPLQKINLRFVGKDTASATTQTVTTSEQVRTTETVEKKDATATLKNLTEQPTSAIGGRISDDINKTSNAKSDTKTGKPMYIPNKTIYLGSKFNQKQFIKEIQARPSLWDPNADGYRDRDIRYTCWMEITDIFYDKPDNSEKDIFAKMLQRKWKGMRDHYRNHMNRIAAGLSNISQYSNYKYLKFLDNDSDKVNTNAEKHPLENTNSRLAPTDTVVDITEESLDTELESSTESESNDINTGRISESVDESSVALSHNEDIPKVNFNDSREKMPKNKLYVGPNYNHREFIKAVENRPAIWDPQSEDYTDRNIRNNCWMEIAEMFFYNPDGDIGWEHKVEFSKTLQRKWKNLRDHYRNLMYRVKEGPMAFEQYANAKYLNFLDRIYENMDDMPSIHPCSQRLRDPKQQPINLGKNYDQVKFAEAIKARPAIWNSNCDDFNDKTVKSRCWMEILDIFYDNDGNERNKQNFVNAVQRKWKCMRDQYKKFKKRVRDGTATPVMYINHECLSFLDDNPDMLAENTSQTTKGFDEAQKKLHDKWKQQTDVQNKISGYVSSKFNRKRLIKEVKIRPALWDLYSEAYNDRDLRAKCWRELVEIFFDKPDANEVEKTAFVSVLRRKWKSMRDRHRKHIQRVNSGLATLNQYSLYPYLSFLDRCFGVNKLNTKIKRRLKNTDSGNVNSIETVKTMETVSALETENTMDTDPFVKMENTYTDTEFIEIGDTQLQGLIMDDVAAKLPITSVQEKHTTLSIQNDMDRWFLLSLIEPLKEVPEQLRLQVKMELMQAIENACSNTLS